MLKKTDYIIFLVIFVADLLTIALKLELIEIIVKPLIMIWVLVVFSKNAKSCHRIFKTAVSAFVLSLAGDVILMFHSKSGLFFLLGMGAFLASQLLFIITFVKTDKKRPQLIFRQPVAFIPIILLGIILYMLLFPKLDLVMKIAVLLYAAVITGMLLSALNRKGRVEDISFILVLIGAILFFISDSLLAINKFWFSIPASGIMIMSTYMAAQFLIMLGLVRQTRVPDK